MITSVSFWQFLHPDKYVRHICHRTERTSICLAWLKSELSCFLDLGAMHGVLCSVRVCVCVCVCASVCAFASRCPPPLFHVSMSSSCSSNGRTTHSFNSPTPGYSGLCVQGPSDTHLFLSSLSSLGPSSPDEEIPSVGRGRVINPTLPLRLY